MKERLVIMTVGDLRRAIDGIPDELEVVVRATDDDTDEQVTAGVWAVGVDASHDDNSTPYLAIEASTDAEPLVQP